MRQIASRFVYRLEWPAFFALILLAWAGLWALQPEAGAAPMPGMRNPYWTVLAMWLLMVAAMMAPSLVPTLATYRDLARAGAGAGGGFAALVLGYLLVWSGFAGLAAGAQTGLARAGLLGGGGASVSWALNAALLALAGLYQLSPVQRACASRCRSPLSFFIGHWRDGAAGALRMGLRLGVLCLGCCWALMALGFVGGVMNLAWMGLATLLMALEKLPGTGPRLDRPLAVLLLAGAGLAALRALAI